MELPRIAAVFATMNRRQVALTCLQRLLDQTRRPDRIVVADNVSEDGTAEALAAAGRDSPGVVEVVRLGENLGSAGGVQVVMDKAFAEGADAVWILDDDSWPEPNALAEMLQVGFRDDRVRLALQVRPGESRFTWPLDLTDPDGRWRTVHSLDELPDAKVIASRGGWTGALLPKQIRDTVGPVEAGLFIRGEDEDYPRRIARAGFRSEVVPGARLEHPGPAKLVRWQFLGRKLYLEPGLAEAKLYYKVRNMVWIKRREGGLPAALAMAAAYAAGLVRVDTMTARRWRAFRIALADGLGGRLGRLDESRLGRSVDRG